MTSFLHIASRVEAAVQAYDSVRNLVDKSAWTEGFRQELVNTAQEFQRISSKNKGAFTPVHPTLAALSIVLDQDEDLGRINASHPDLQEHEYYDPNFTFPSSTPDLLPPSGNRWWERLAEDARRENANNPPPQNRLPATKVTKVTLHVSEPEKESEHLSMEVDEEPKDSQSHGRPRTVKGAATTRKRKSSSAGAARGTAKRRTQSNRRADPAEPSPGGSEASPVEQAPEGLSIKCHRCADAGADCIVTPNGPCKRCKHKKQGCSLMPVNPETGKTDRRAHSPSQLREFRLKQAEAPAPPQAEAPPKSVKKGKKRAKNSPGAEEKEGSGLSPSPLAALANLESLTLHSGGSSAANSPSDGPAASHQAPSPGVSAPAPSSDPKPCDISKRPADLIVTVPGTSQTLNSRSHVDTSPASDDGGNAARIAALEKKQSALERQMLEFDVRLKKLGA